VVTAGQVLDRAQEWLHDSGTIWPRAELFTWLEDGYRQLLAQSQAVRRFAILDLPPRVAVSITHAWERHDVDRRETWWPWPVLAAREGIACTSRWEVQALEGVTPEPAAEGITQPWERAYVNPDGLPFRFMLPRAHERIVKLWWDDQLLGVSSVRELDELETNWMSIEGEPVAWVTGTGPNRTVEVYEVQTGYQEPYRLSGSWPYGIVRSFSGDRTYELDFFGPASVLRRIVSADRQYLAVWPTDAAAPYGIPRTWQSSVGNLLLLHVVGPEVEALAEEDELALLPAQAAKYVRYYVLARAFNRSGEGYAPNMATFYLARFQRGVQLLRQLGQLAYRDRTYARQPEPRGQRPPRVRLPSNYPAVWR
jgi:hypothetical protein